ncbi:Oidioi.mRNA.OKI2018_I69.chr1.g3088.t2.cds [Oikopleura dioica]|uniref:Oidioi.mRNA.OKI2018_I69.chr1.g3088.t2.cds n=1 Tax=Oikopleura dioica TaxID=34765 RepID=A0ABN7ST42_OIKDI|nr:Oidioi.mRNA.OKI2018_I69.chr1.g3088.t2.cds [Oikopleura dioica]
MKLGFFFTASASASVTFTAFKESGFTRPQAKADCESRGLRLANIYSQEEQDLLNQVITDADGLERAFWLGMTQGNDTEKNTIKDIDGNDLRFYDGWREDQPSNKLNHPNDKHTSGEYEDCVRQFGLEGWNDAICSRTWSGAKKNNIAMGHICEDRPSSAAVEELDSHFQIWANTFTNANIAARWEATKFSGFSLRLKRILKLNCAESEASIGSMPAVDTTGDAQDELDKMIQGYKDFFATYFSNCRGGVLNTKLNEKIDRWAALLSDKIQN